MNQTLLSNLIQNILTCLPDPLKPQWTNNSKPRSKSLYPDRFTSPVDRGLRIRNYSSYNPYKVLSPVENVRGWQRQHHVMQAYRIPTLPSQQNEQEVGKCNDAGRTSLASLTYRSFKKPRYLKTILQP